MFGDELVGVDEGLREGEFDARASVDVEQGGFALEAARDLR
jgi:hypothetical protein